MRVVLGVVALLALIFAAPGLVAQSTAHVPRVGILFIGSPAPNDPSASPIARGLRDLGHVDGRNIILEFRYAGGRPDRLAALAAELVRPKVDVLLAGGPGPLAALRGVAAADSIGRGGGS